MSKPLPTVNSKWVKNVYQEDVMDITEDSPTRYILEVDLAMNFSNVKSVK